MGRPRPLDRLLLVRSAAPGLSIVGLPCEVQIEGDPRWHPGMRFDPTSYGRMIPVWVVRPAHASDDSRAPRQTVLLADQAVVGWRVSAGESAVADRLARHLAASVHLELGTTAPGWRHRVDELTEEQWYELYSERSSLDDESGLLRSLRLGVRPFDVPDGVDPSDDRVLDDGSRFSDRLALVLTVVAAEAQLRGAPGVSG